MNKRTALPVLVSRKISARTKLTIYCVYRLVGAGETTVWTNKLCSPDRDHNTLLVIQFSIVMYRHESDQSVDIILRLPSGQLIISMSINSNSYSSHGSDLEQRISINSNGYS